MDNILIIQTAFIGDVILATPMVTELANQYPDANIDVLAIPAGKEVWKNNPFIRNIICYDKNGSDKGFKAFWRVIKSIKLGKYDWVISPHRSLRSGLISYCSGAEMRTSFDKSTGAKIFYNRLVPYRQIHEIERNLSLIKNDYSTEIKPSIFPEKAEVDNIEEILSKNRINISFVVVAPGSAWKTKRWPENKFLRLCHSLDDNDIQVILIGGESDKEISERIYQNSTNCLDLTGKLNIRESYQVIKKSKCLVTNDSAPLHLGSAAGTPTVAIFGATVPEFGFGPYGNQKSVILGVNGLDCRPCGIHGSQACPIKTFDCMLHISPYQVSTKVKEIIAYADN